MAVFLRGERNEGMAHGICRWDPGCERDHAYRAKAPTDDRMTQDQTINALAVIGLAKAALSARQGAVWCQQSPTAAAF